MTELSRKGKVKIKWDCLSHEYSRDKEKDIITKFSKKYNIPKSSITVDANLVQIDSGGNVTTIQDNIISNIQDPQFQQKLFEDYIAMNNITDINIEKIIEIDNEINRHIDYNQYDKYGKIVIKRLEWSNFLSYGADNEFDFTQLKGMVGLAGDPSNQSGKTTFALSLLKFALYGTCDKAKTLLKIFNKHLKNATEIYVRLFVEINNENFVIERKVKRPKKVTEKSKAEQTIKYYRVINGLWDIDDPLEEYDPETYKNESDDNSKTNKIIKECLCKESDFDLIASATSKNLDDIVFIGDTERVRLLSRWVGILPIQEKAELAKNKWSKEISPKLISNMYNVEDLKDEITGFKETIKAKEDEIVKINDKLSITNKTIHELTKEKEAELAKKNAIDAALVKMDIHTQNRRAEELIEHGKKLRLNQEEHTKTKERLANVEYDKVKFECNRKEILALVEEIATIKSQINQYKKANTDLEQGKVCPTCHRAFDEETVKKIEDDMVNNVIAVNELMAEGIKKNGRKTELEEENAKLEQFSNQVDERIKAELKLAQVNVEIEHTLQSYNDVQNLINEYNKNADNIRINNDINIRVDNLNARLTVENNIRDTALSDIRMMETEIVELNRKISNNESTIVKLYLEQIEVKHFKLYQDLVGKHGIQTILINGVLPVLNSTINNLLGGICDFSVEIVMNEKNDVQFQIIQETEDGEEIRADLSSASGYELTLAAIAIRSALARVSSFTKISFSLWDEVTGRCADENLPYVQSMFDKIKDDYQFIFIISHSKIVNDWCTQKVTVTKDEKKISHIVVNY
jgi:DNA repair exonuclease SbcCD ATPase subunit